MSWWYASQRYGLEPAPGGLGLVQDFLNTVRIGDYGEDLLADPALANRWTTKAVKAWSHLSGIDAAPLELSEADLAKLRALRTTIGGMVAGEPVAPDGAPASASFVVSDSGEVRLEPVGNGWRWLASALWSEILRSQLLGEWRRVKRCRNPHCPSTFYDRSKNNSGVWHDVKTCGNAANLRASRARRRAAGAATSR